MRRLLLISLVFCFAFSSSAQAPDNFNFQTVLHYTHGTAMPNHEVKIIINILSQSANGDIVYREEHTVESNAFGLINLKIGTGEVLYGNWNDILWNEENEYLMIELDTTATGNNYVDMGTTQLLSVPYALYANETTTTYIWQSNDNGIYYNNGKVGFKSHNPSEAIEVGDGESILVSSSHAALADNDLIKIKMAADTAQPNINWKDTLNNFAAALSVREFITNPLTSQKVFLLATSDFSYNRRYRIKIRYDQDIADFNLNSCNLIVNKHFIVGDENQAPTSTFWAHQWIKNGHVLGIGDKNWESEGIYGNAAAEFYRNDADNFILLNAAGGTNRCQVKFRRGNAEWMIRNDQILTIKRNDQLRIKFMEDGKIKIGSNDPQYKLDVYGNINIPVGYSYLVGGGKSGGKYAEYFESEEQIAEGELAGIDQETGLVKKYEAGDIFLGVVCNASGFIANSNNTTTKSNNYVVVGLEGLVKYKENEIQRNGQQAYTADGQYIGPIVGNQILLK